MTQNFTIDLDKWLAGNDVLDAASSELPIWVAGFDPDRQLVFFKIGPFQRLFLRPLKFTKRFYHRVFPLPVEVWPYRRQIQLFENFCTLDVDLVIRFQATLHYAQQNIEYLEHLTQHIQSVYESVIEDKLNQVLTELADGLWVQNGLGVHERNLVLSVCEILTQQHIQAEALCHISARFVDFPDVQLGRDRVYLQVLKRTFDLNVEKNDEIQRQQALSQQQALIAKQQELEHFKKMAEMQRQLQMAEAEAQIQLLKDKEEQAICLSDVELRLFTQQISYEQRQKEAAFEIELQSRQGLEAKQRMAEKQQLAENLLHQAAMDEQQVLAEIKRKQTATRHWLEAEQWELQSVEGNQVISSLSD